YKSTTEIYNNKVWQDVYKKEIKGIPVYIKFKLFQDHFLLTSFKPDES
ncbi:MAG: type II toxin-antitoxin system MqsR family toxin, partial [Desulfobacteraceae bacterium]|nr:type II toxin-antitoxin system MqsR family toxin [Desulfobacteraceae bacterium]